MRLAARIAKIKPSETLAITAKTNSLRVHRRFSSACRGETQYNISFRVDLKYLHTKLFDILN